VRLLDLFSGRWGWSQAFAARGWQCVGIDLTEPPEIPANCSFVKADILQLRYSQEIGFYVIDGPVLGFFDAVCASSPCEQFSVHGLKCFHKSPPYPTLGIELFNHSRAICEESGCLYIMENVRAAQDFVGNAANHCGSFYLWGTGVPILLPQGIKKGMKLAGISGSQARATTKEELLAHRRADNMMWASSKSDKRKSATASVATIAPLLSNTVCDYFERILESQLALPGQPAA
jgi:hypothetical protein